MIDTGPSELILAGYAPLSSRGFALPCFVASPQSNAWYTAICSVEADHSGEIVGFDVFESGGILRLPPEQHRIVALHEPWTDVFIWKNSALIGTPADIWIKLGPERDEMLGVMPLTGLDLALGIPDQDVFALVGDAFAFMRRRFGPEDADAWRYGTLTRQQLMIAFRRLARDAGLGDDVASALGAIEVEHLGSSRIKVLLPFDVIRAFTGRGRSEELARRASEALARLGSALHDIEAIDSPPGTPARRISIETASQSAPIDEQPAFDDTSEGDQEDTAEIDQLVEQIRTYNPRTDENLIRRAYRYGTLNGRTHQTAPKRRQSSPAAIAKLVCDQRLDDATIVAALIHGGSAETEAARIEVGEIEQLFGREVGQLVDGLKRMRKLELVPQASEQSENLRKLLVAIAGDVRVLLVKLAARLHEMRGLERMPEAAQFRLAQETLEIYAPLAGRVGMQEMREELEDLSFRAIDPSAYGLLLQRLDAITARNPDLITEVESQLATKFRERGLAARVIGRRKKPFAIWLEMQRRSLGFEQLTHYAFRIITQDHASCYRALGIVHTVWPVVPGKFVDTISTPTEMDYRAIHTTVIGPGKQRIELQIRTDEGDFIAELGTTASSFESDADSFGRPSKQESDAFASLRQTIGALSQHADTEDFRKHTKLELFRDQVFCFTPKGKLIALPRGASAIDFAYAVHTNVGNSAVGCKINGEFAALSTELENENSVEVLISDAQTAPPAAWETLARTRKARAAIRRATRKAVDEQYADLGRRIVERFFERIKLDFVDYKLKGALPRLRRGSVDEVMAAVGRGEIKASNVARAIYPDYQEDQGLRPGGKKGVAIRVRFFTTQENRTSGWRSTWVGDLKSGLPVKFAPQGGALPGERIVGIVTRNEGLTIYPIQSRSLEKFEGEPERWVDARWEESDSGPRRFPARILVRYVDEPGNLAAIASVINEQDGNIDNISTRRSLGFNELIVDLDVYDLRHLSAIMAHLRVNSSVDSVERIEG
nr:MULTISPECIES: RelA/SpoT AH/RIS domain-containing protein [unclassified Bradyrhizobium]